MYLVCWNQARKVVPFWENCSNLSGSCKLCCVSFALHAVSCPWGQHARRTFGVEAQIHLFKLCPQRQYFPLRLKEFIKQCFCEGCLGWQLAMSSTATIPGVLTLSWGGGGKFQLLTRTEGFVDIQGTEMRSRTHDVLGLATREKLKGPLVRRGWNWEVNSYEEEVPSPLFRSTFRRSET